FMIDSGSAVNLTRRDLLYRNAHVDDSVQISLQGISLEPIITTGRLQIQILGKLTNFHVLPSGFPFKEHGISGNEFFKQHNANIDY
ncbi:hypothetical protein EAI_05124, partial [Harpegnathos saltator]